MKMQTQTKQKSKTKKLENQTKQKTKRKEGGKRTKGGGRKGGRKNDKGKGFRGAEERRIGGRKDFLPIKLNRHECFEFFTT